MSSKRGYAQHKRNVGSLDPYARLSGAVYMNAFNTLRKAVDLLDMDELNKEAQGRKDNALTFLYSDNPFKRYLEMKGHELPIQKGIEGIVLRKEDQHES